MRNPRRENYILENGRITLKGGNDGLSTPLGHPTMIALRQEEFDIEVQPTEIPLDSLRTIEGIKELIEGKISENE